MANPRAWPMRIVYWLRMAQGSALIEHPNRDKAESRATKAVVVVLLLVSAALLAIVTLGGWDTLQGAKSLQIAYILVYLVLAYQIARWRSGLLPVAAALAIVLLIFAAISGPEWFARDRDGFSNPPMDESLLGLLTVLLVPLQLVLILFAARGFSQKWSVEVERGGGPGPHAPQPA
jgi:lysylphosphatidylglycerol synthetase-like protein (DUF2156 family)